MKKKSSPKQKTLLIHAMRQALADYSDTLDLIKQHEREQINITLPETALLQKELEVYRYRYYELRIQYEKNYGDLQSYEIRLRDFFMWRKETQLCQAYQPYDHFTRASVLAKPLDCITNFL